MRRLIAVTSVLVLSFAGSAFAQANMGMDSSGRFDGSPPLGTSREDEAPSGGFAIPFDTFQTGSTTGSGNIQWTQCPPQRRGVQGNSQACLERN
ncbi:putative secreted protein (plasmid) [Rhizobium favelukesii]|uniref:Secreted protein n=1 Tax=Rhizobium favelukesii TaxID=348824 RepID=W6RQG5_9HYPH|nr:putative secreted protein [Rhizobium favelukesii]